MLSQKFNAKSMTSVSAAAKIEASKKQLSGMPSLMSARQKVKRRRTRNRELLDQISLVLPKKGVFWLAVLYECDAEMPVYTTNIDRDRREIDVLKRIAHLRTRCNPI